MSTRRVTELTIYPTGSEGDPDAYLWALRVRYTGPRDEGSRATGGYQVTTLFKDTQLSRAGGWETWVPNFRRWQFRWATLEEATEAAEAVVDTLATSHGVTWAQWVEWRAHRE